MKNILSTFGIQSTRSKRLDFFAAHAPSKIPEHFKPVMPPPPRIRDFVPNEIILYRDRSKVVKLNKDEINELLKKHYFEGTWYFKEGENELPTNFIKEMNTWLEARDKEYDEREKWKHDYEEQRIVQWRLHFAKLMVEANF